ncbi:Uu.00g084010.m01.CDS01 [Anthostomella pinea]|uniref:Uu.00g084010.m01.CDS01 n=1 Tax=Anthostomella pinea TaxID=933095 RepID=A0AAI8YJN3_9PEZI|nr:Uu.00g084010.m01.CDS01 [Anthostomella pinea]
MATTTVTATETLPAPALTIEVARRSEDVSAPPSTTLQAFDNIIDESMSANAEPEYPTGAKFYIIVLSLCLILVLEGLDESIVSTAVPAITDHFHTVADIGWYSSAYRLPLCAFQFFFGKLYKIFSVKRVMLASVGIFLLGSLLCATAATSKMFVLGRAVAGLGCAGILAGCYTLLVQILPLRLRPLYAGLFGGIETVAVVVAPVLGGVLTQSLSWRWCFWISLPIGAPVVLTKAIFAQLDLLGSALFVPAITSLFLALSWAGTKYAFDSPLVLCLYAAFAILIAGFVWDQYRKQDAALLPPRIFRRRSIIAGFIFSFCCNGSLNIINYYMPTYLQEVREYSPATSGYLMVLILVGFLVGMLVHGAGTTLTGFYTPFMLAGSVLMPLAAGLVTTWTLDSGLAKLITYSSLVGFATGIGFQGPQSAAQTTLSEPDGPLGLSVILFAQHFGPALFVSVAQTIFTNRLVVNLHAVAPQLDAKAIEQMGLGQLKASIGPQKLQDVLRGFDRSLVQTWYLPLGLACATAVGSLMMEWRSVKEKRS